MGPYVDRIRPSLDRSARWVGFVGHGAEIGKDFLAIWDWQSLECVEENCRETPAQTSEAS
jgi:hypothetical protein